MVTAVIAAVFHYYCAGFGSPEPRTFRGLHLEYLTTAQGYLYALNNLERVGTQDPNQASTAAANVQRSADTLRNLGVSEGQIEEMRKTRALTPHITIASPVDGFILQRNVLVGQRVEVGSELYRVADLRRVWIFADVYESEQSFIRPGSAPG